MSFSGDSEDDYLSEEISISPKNTTKKLKFTNSTSSSDEDEEFKGKIEGYSINSNDEYYLSKKDIKLLKEPPVKFKIHKTEKYKGLLKLSKKYSKKHKLKSTTTVINDDNFIDDDCLNQENEKYLNYLKEDSSHLKNSITLKDCFKLYLTNVYNKINNIKIKDKNNLNLINHSINKINNLLNFKMNILINLQKWSRVYLNHIELHPLLKSIDYNNTFIKVLCESCHKNNNYSQKILSLKKYTFNYNTFKESKSNQIEIYLGKNCYIRTLLYHRLYHYRFYLINKIKSNEIVNNKFVRIEFSKLQRLLNLCDVFNVKNSMTYSDIIYINNFQYHFKKKKRIENNFENVKKIKKFKNVTKIKFNKDENNNKDEIEMSKFEINILNSIIEKDDINLDLLNEEF